MVRESDEAEVYREILSYTWNQRDDLYSNSEVFPNKQKWITKTTRPPDLHVSFFRYTNKTICCLNLPLYCYSRRKRSTFFCFSSADDNLIQLPTFFLYQSNCFLGGAHSGIFPTGTLVLAHTFFNLENEWKPRFFIKKKKKNSNFRKHIGKLQSICIYCDFKIGATKSFHLTCRFIKNKLRIYFFISFFCKCNFFA